MISSFSSISSLSSLKFFDALSSLTSSPLFYHFISYHLLILSSPLIKSPILLPSSSCFIYSHFHLIIFLFFSLRFNRSPFLSSDFVVYFSFLFFIFTLFILLYSSSHPFPIFLLSLPFLFSSSFFFSSFPFFLPFFFFSFYFFSSFFLFFLFISSLFSTSQLLSSLLSFT